MSPSVRDVDEWTMRKKSRTNVPYERMRFGECSYIVMDCETTGFHPNARHRIVEIALLPVSAGGLVGEPWCTLLDPERDLGPTHIHGIRGRDLQDAPRFCDVLGDVLERLAGQVVVAHNAQFDGAFLTHELRRAGVDAEPSTLCTLQLARALGCGGSRFRLTDCCAEAGVPHDGIHSAAGDAMACAKLFAGWLPALADRALADFGTAPPPPREAWPVSHARAATKARLVRGSGQQEPSFLATLVQAAEAPACADVTSVVPYLDVLDRALEDRRLSLEEREDLAATAAMLGLTADRVRNVHADYVGMLVAHAYRDGVVTPREREDLDMVADALGVAGVDDALTAIANRGHPLTAGDASRTLVGRTVCFTGALLCELDGEPITRERAHELARDAGLDVADRVTKALDILVVADPHSLSGKARKAREYGTRIIAETAFWPMIGVVAS